MNRTDRAMQQLCKDVIVLDSDEDEAPSLSDMARRAAEILGWLAPKRRPSLPRHSAVAKAEARKQQKKESRRERAATIRAAVFGRAGGKCEWCWDWFTDLRPGEWHHLFGGGLRRKREAEDTTAAICVPCHRGWEAGHMSVLGQALGWAHKHGFVAARQAIEKRLAKVAEARRSGAEGDGR